ncbi:L,D-transpeptidase family protein [Sulfurovum sp. zt1-1]|uniref:L,D-transpeptidase family protein n=1 Tax=Sulfurovum zhangzhouensis TaxID=3019067 RepID=A0ABT7QVQ3_9BACT|nr:L,D-transpeptidase family protein [Sulfurovum zhangzhouensis]MDM5270910.1 L,D-transpeptidase family protein [Sulfurovum zhangzhouensis]
MKKIIFLLIHTLLFASAPDQVLKIYQAKYSLCHGQTNYQITECLLNGSINYYRLRGDRNRYRRVSKTQFREQELKGNVYHYVMTLMPRTKRYQGLKNYIDYLYSIREQYTPPRFRGNKEEDIIRIKRVLNLLQDSRLREDTEITERFERAILEFQRRHGLEVDGVIGPNTKRELKQSIHSIITKVKKNLELERIASPKGSKYILVNIPEFKMYYYIDHKPVLDMKVIVGKPNMRTPVLIQTMKYIVKNPRWNVPPSIYAKEYAHKSMSYLKRNGFAFDSQGKLYQKEGPDNALGLVKFLFPNRYNVYMHDTPTKPLFHKRVRAFSHGCIRLEKPMELLHKLGYEYDTDENEKVALSEQIPVYVEYHTVWVDEEGIVQFRNDIYGYEWKLFN